MKVIHKQSDQEIATEQAIERGFDPDTIEGALQIGRNLAAINEQVSRASAHGDGKGAFAAPLSTVDSGTTRRVRNKGGADWGPRDVQQRRTRFVGSDDVIGDASDVEEPNPAYQEEIGVLKHIARTGPPGPPPRPNLRWKEETHRWVKETGEEFEEPKHFTYEKWREHYSKWGEGLTTKEFRSLISYTSGGYKVNRDLRQAKVLTTHAMELVEGLDSALEKVEIPENMITFRGLSYDAVKDIQEGDVFQDDGFMSVSLDVNVLFNFDTGASMTIMVPKGYSGALIDAMNKEGYDNPEQEVLLRRGTKLQVHSVFTEYEEGKPNTIIYASVLT